jgi:hypothetical protein
VRALAVVLALVAAAARAPAQVEDDLHSIAQRSDTIVLARCVEMRSHWDEDGRVIVTDATLTVERAFKGDDTGSIIVRVLGGRVGNVGMGVSHGAIFAPGERVVALLRRSRHGAYHVVTSAGSSALIVREDGGSTHATIGNHVVSLDELARQFGTPAQ